MGRQPSHVIRPRDAHLYLAAPNPTPIVRGDGTIAIATAEGYNKIRSIPFGNYPVATKTGSE